jgi:hypothetical protein
VRRRSWAILLISSMLLLAIVPLRDGLSNSSASVSSPPAVQSPPSFVPAIHVPANVDADHNGIANSLDQEITAMSAAGTASKYVNVTVMLKNPPTANDTNGFVSSGGLITTGSWTNALYGFGGRIPYNALSVFAKKDQNLLLVEKDAIGHTDLAYATQQVGARPYVWSSLGLQGDPNSAIALLDTGIDPTHPDFSPGYGNLNFSDKIIGWQDEVTGATTPFDDSGHGSHVAGIAA